MTQGCSPLPPKEEVGGVTDLRAVSDLWVRGAGWVLAWRLTFWGIH